MVTTSASSRAIVGARIASVAGYVPPRVLTNADLEKMVDTTDDWIMKRVGIRERHIVGAGVATSDLAKEASLMAIERAGLTPADIDLILVATTTPDTFFPSTACVLQSKIGATRAWGYDLGAACSGFTYALTTAAHLVAGGASRHALVVGADVMSSIIDYTDRTTCVLFGDGAGAVVVKAHARRRGQHSRLRALHGRHGRPGALHACWRQPPAREPRHCGRPVALCEAGWSGRLQVCSPQHGRGLSSYPGPKRPYRSRRRFVRAPSGEQPHHSRSGGEARPPTREDPHQHRSIRQHHGGHHSAGAERRG